MMVSRRFPETVVDEVTTTTTVIGEDVAEERASNVAVEVSEEVKDTVAVDEAAVDLAEAAMSPNRTTSVNAWDFHTHSWIPRSPKLTCTIPGSFYSIDGVFCGIAFVS